MKKWIVIVLVVVAGGFWLFQKWPDWKPKASGVQDLTTRPTIAVVENRRIDFKITAAGDIGPAEQVSVRPEINGKVELLPVDIGDRVKKGEVLFTLDDSDLQTEKASRKIEIEGAKLQLEKAERNFVRSQELYQTALISKELFEDTKTEFELAKNALDRADKNLRLVEDKLSKTKIVAPFDCTVLTRPVSIGQAVSGSGGFNSGTEVLTIADLNNMIVNAHVNQADVTRIKPEQEVEVQVESVPGLVMKGTVERIAPQSTIKNSIKGYAARVQIKGSDIDRRVRPGMTANLSIPVASADNAVAVPLAAIFTEQGERFAYVKKDEETFEKRLVQIGLADYDYAEVLSGLNVGETVSLEDKASRGVKGLAASKPAAGSGALSPGRIQSSVNSFATASSNNPLVPRSAAPANKAGGGSAPTGAGSGGTTRPTSGSVGH